MKHICLATLLVAIIGVAGITGCTSSGGSDVEKIATTIQTSTEALVPIGLVAIPDQEQAHQAATEALGILDSEVLPLLNGDEAGLASGLKKILSLSAFDKTPTLQKVKIILNAGLPILTKKIPSNLIENATNKVPEDTRAYLKAFFTGARDGLADYLGDTRTRSVDEKPKAWSSPAYAEMRKKLSE